MFLYQSNRLETLLARFLELIAAPTADLLAPEIVLVQNQGMGHWLRQEIAFRLGISAGLQLPLIGRFALDLGQRLAGKPKAEDSFQPAILRWRIAALLPAYLTGPDPLFQELATYLEKDAEGSKLDQLSGQISAVFGQYMLYRPEMLQAWLHQSNAEHWQARLWQGLTAGVLPMSACLAASVKGLLAALPEQGSGKNTKLPQQLHLFGLSALPPQHLELIHSLSQRIEVHLFHLHPFRHSWPNSQKETQNTAESAGMDTHPLLASPGKKTVDFSHQLLACEPQQHDLSAKNPGSNLLACLQNDLLHCHDRSAPDQEPYQLQDGDCSLRFHIAFSPLREVQILHDRLLDLFQRLPELKPDDILICAPNIQLYAAAVAGVFDKTSAGPRIPWAMVEHMPAQRHLLIRCFLDLLDLFGKRFAAPEILALCEHAALLRRFGLDTAFVPRLYAWVEQSGIRWAMDAAHCQEMYNLVSEQHTWRFGLDRLLLAHLTGPSDKPFAGRQPASCLLNGEGPQLGSFCSLLDTLAHWQHFCQSTHDATTWRDGLLLLLADLFAPNEEEEEGLELCRLAVTELEQQCREAGYSASISPLVLKTRLTEILTRGSSKLALSGRLQFCNLATLRGLPFRVICLLGLNYQDFPRNPQAPTFNLIAADPRRGDCDQRSDDCSLFLEAILSARDSLQLFWLGRSQHDDRPLPPSVLVSELQDYLNQSCICSEQGNKKPSEVLTTLHPMQPFSPQAYDGSLPTASYNPAWMPSARKGPAPLFFNQPLSGATLLQSANGDKKIAMAQLLRFWKHPVRFFLEQHLELQVREEVLSVEGSEPFSLDALAAFQLRQHTVEALLAGQSLTKIQQTMAASSCLPQGIVGQCSFNEVTKHCPDYVLALAPLLAEPFPPLAVDCQIGSYHISGQIDQLYQSGRVVWRTGAVKGSDLMEMWVQHLLLSLWRPKEIPLRSCYLAPNESKSLPILRNFAPLTANEAETLLLDILDFFWQGLIQPLPFFPRSSLSWAQTMQKGKGNEIKEARKCWEKQVFSERPGEGEEAAYQYFYANRDPLDADFVKVSTLLLPLLNHISSETAEDKHA